ncbi:two-component system regulatory protein YycI [Sporosarcina sp. Te-1]|uniref:two-component system regulatory protein YycI n=1 Tax=Sporosarcina sp. Te-1 TaxID=2818390 RepID=UPI001A9D803C|nr:two-component system regulatory protein YycI [Sporosarcina sp. Te-1]QTD40148.1 two-component system regulatory protein YycI [Sporosarcina sp. Te-1]
MDWNKAKTIFIVVFSILNIFLYSLYFNQRSEAQNVALIGRTSLEEVLKQDNITYDVPQNVKTKSSYISAKIATFSKDELDGLKDQTIMLLENDTTIQSKLTTDVAVKDSNNQYQFDHFLANYVYAGNEYSEWEINETEQKAVFFQVTGDEPIYFSPNAMLTVYWDDEGNITGYTQKMLKSFSNYNHKELLTPVEAVGSLVTRGYVKPDSKVQYVKLGYSTLVQLQETQVFAPTWNVRVELKDGQVEEHFINAIEGKVIEFQLNPPQETDEDEVEEE